MRKKNNKKGKSGYVTKDNKRVSATRVSVFSMIFVLLVTIYAYMQLLEFQKGILEVYAVQQDGYVQLVLDQINLKNNRDNEEIVNEILTTLDASSNRYWTFSEDGNIVFVKDVLETNRYKGFTTETYFEAFQGKEFLAKLQQNKVTHGTITLDHRDYVISGVNFMYQENPYSICLLTSTDVVLDQNEYLSAKVSLILLGALILGTFVAVGLVLAYKAERWYRDYEITRLERDRLFANVERLNALLNKEQLFHPQTHCFTEEAVPVLLEKLETKQSYPMDWYVLDCETEKKREEFLTRTRSVLGEKVIRSLAGERYCVLYFLQDSAPMREDLEQLLNENMSKIVLWERIEKDSYEYLSKIYERVMQQVKKYE